MPQSNQEADPVPLSNQEEHSTIVSTQEMDSSTLSSHEADPRHLSNQEADPTPQLNPETDPAPLSNQEADPVIQSNSEMEPEPLSNQEADSAPVSNPDPLPLPNQETDAVSLMVAVDLAPSPLISCDSPPPATPIELDFLHIDEEGGGSTLPCSPEVLGISPQVSQSKSPDLLPADRTPEPCTRILSSQIDSHVTLTYFADPSPPTADSTPPTADPTPPTADPSPPTADSTPPKTEVLPLHLLESSSSVPTSPELSNAPSLPQPSPPPAAPNASIAPAHQELFIVRSPPEPSSPASPEASTLPALAHPPVAPPAQKHSPASTPSTVVVAVAPSAPSLSIPPAHYGLSVSAEMASSSSLTSANQSYSELGEPASHGPFLDMALDDLLEFGSSRTGGEAYWGLDLEEEGRASRDETLTPLTEASWMEDSPTPSSCPGTPESAFDFSQHPLTTLDRTSASGHVGKPLHPAPPHSDHPALCCSPETHPHRAESWVELTLDPPPALSNPT